MGKLFSRVGSTSYRILVAIFFFSRVGLTSAATDPSSPDQSHYENAWVVFVLFALVGLEAWVFWQAYKHRAIEEEPEALVQAPRPILRAQTPVQRKKTSRER